MKKLLLFGLLLWLVGCTPNVSHDGTQAILDFYGGQLLANVGVAASTEADAVKGHYLELVLVNDELTKGVDQLSVPASNCAYLFYHNVIPAERAKYDYIKVRIQGKNASYEESFSMKDLGIVDLAKDQFDSFGQVLKHEQYEQLPSLIVPGVVDATGLEAFMKGALDNNQRFGPVTGFRLNGFAFAEYEDHGQKRRYVDMFALVTRPRNQSLGHLAIDPEATLPGPYVLGMSI
jgi:hypothetical protein